MLSVAEILNIMKDFEFFSAEAEELFAPFFENPKIILDSYSEPSEDEYDSWSFIIESKGEHYFVNIVNPDNGNNGLNTFEARHIIDFTDDLKTEFIRYAVIFTAKKGIFSCRFDIDNTSDINEFQ